MKACWTKDGIDTFLKNTVETFSEQTRFVAKVTHTPQNVYVAPSTQFPLDQTLFTQHDDPTGFFIPDATLIDTLCKLRVISDALPWSLNWVTGRAGSGKSHFINLLEQSWREHHPQDVSVIITKGATSLTRLYEQLLTSMESLDPEYRDFIEGAIITINPKDPLEVRNAVLNFKNSLEHTCYLKQLDHSDLDYYYEIIKHIFKRENVNGGRFQWLMCHRIIRHEFNVPRDVKYTQLEPFNWDEAKVDAPQASDARSFNYADLIEIGSYVHSIKAFCNGLKHGLRTFFGACEKYYSFWVLNNRPAEGINPPDEIKAVLNSFLDFMNQQILPSVRAKMVIRKDQKSFPDRINDIRRKLKKDHPNTRMILFIEDCTGFQEIMEPLLDAISEEQTKPEIADVIAFIGVTGDVEGGLYRKWMTDGTRGRTAMTIDIDRAEDGQLRRGLVNTQEGRKRFTGHHMRAVRQGAYLEHFKEQSHDIQPFTENKCISCDQQERCFSMFGSVTLDDNSDVGLWPFTADLLDNLSLQADYTPRKLQQHLFSIMTEINDSYQSDCSTKQYPRAQYHPQHNKLKNAVAAQLLKEASKAGYDQGLRAFIGNYTHFLNLGSLRDEDFERAQVFNLTSPDLKDSFKQINQLSDSGSSPAISHQDLEHTDSALAAVLPHEKPYLKIDRCLDKPNEQTLLELLKEHKDGLVDLVYHYVFPRFAHRVIFQNHFDVRSLKSIIKFGSDSSKRSHWRFGRNLKEQIWLLKGLKHYLLLSDHATPGALWLSSVMDFEAFIDDLYAYVDKEILTPKGLTPENLDGYLKRTMATLLYRLGMGLNIQLNAESSESFEASIIDKLLTLENDLGLHNIDLDRQILSKLPETDNVYDAYGEWTPSVSWELKDLDILVCKLAHLLLECHLMIKPSAIGYAEGRFAQLLISFHSYEDIDKYMAQQWSPILNLSDQQSTALESMNVALLTINHEILVFQNKLESHQQVLKDKQQKCLALLGERTYHDWNQQIIALIDRFDHFMRASNLKKLRDQFNQQLQIYKIVSSSLTQPVLGLIQSIDLAEDIDVKRELFSDQLGPKLLRLELLRLDQLLLDELALICQEVHALDVSIETFNHDLELKQRESTFCIATFNDQEDTL